MKVIIHGSQGRMGKELLNLVENGYRNSVVAAAVDRKNIKEEALHTYNKLSEFSGEADCIIDFSHPAMLPSLLDYARERKIPLIIGTTGYGEEELESIREASKEIPIFQSYNLSIGISLLIELAKTMAKTLSDADIEIVETHHNRKVDAPSGTALMIADGIKEVRPNAKYVMGRDGEAKRNKDDIGIHALRMGNIFGMHEVIVGTDTQTISLKHQVHNRAIFAEGALVAAEFLIKCSPGLYNMKNLLEDR